MQGKILRTGLWWPIVSKYAEYFQNCDVCQRVGNPSMRYEMPLIPQVTLKVFDKWVLDFVGPINPLAKRSGERYIITMTEYLTRWIEAIVVKDYITETAMHFLFEKVVTIFGCPRVMMSYHGNHFINSTIQAMTE